MPRMTLSLRRKTGKDIGSRRASRSAHSRIVKRQTSLVGEQPQSRRRIGGTSAKSGRGWQSLDQPEATKSQPRNLRSKQISGAHHEVLVNRPNLVGSRTENLKAQIMAWLKRKPVA